MKFTCSTKPLQNALKLGVIKSNISKFYQKSNFAKVTCTKDALKVNLEASKIVTQITLHGSGDEDQEVSMFVDCQVFNDLVSTFDADVVTFEFVEGGIVLHAGKSKFTLPRMLGDLDDTDSDFKVPQELNSNEMYQSVDLKSDDWKFVADHQMFAIAINYIHPVYCRVWTGENGDVLVGDYDNSIFTHSKHGSLGRTCLLPPTIINLFTSLPEGSKLIDTGDSYIVKVKTDGYEYVTEFTPELESDEKVGSYNSEIFLDLFAKKGGYITLDATKVTKFLNQASLLVTYDSLVTFTVDADSAAIAGEAVDCRLPVEKSENADSYSCQFKANFLKFVFSNLDNDKVNVTPIFEDDEKTEIAGVLFWTDNMSVLLAPTE